MATSATPLDFQAQLARSYFERAERDVRLGCRKLMQLQDEGALPDDTDWVSFQKMALAVIKDICDAAGWK